MYGCTETLQLYSRRFLTRGPGGGIRAASAWVRRTEQITLWGPGTGSNFDLPGTFREKLNTDSKGGE